MTKKLIATTNIFSSEIKVYNDNLLERGLLGNSNSMLNEIVIHEGCNDDVHFEVVMHELIHMILEKIGRNDLSQDETFVNTLGNALSQATSEWEDIEEDLPDDE